MKKNKKIILIILLPIALILSILLLLFYGTNYSVLEVKDLYMMLEDNKTPAITIPETKEEYFNKWQCFSVKDINITEAEVDYRGWRKVPSIDIKTKKRSISFDIDPEKKWDNELVLRKWSNLISKERSVCIFGAFLQKEENGMELWYIQRIKTKRGYWDRSVSVF